MLRLFSAPSVRFEQAAPRKRTSGPRRALQLGRRLSLESLEPRAMLATITVNTASDAEMHVGTSLRDAIATANTDAASGVSDTINFDAGLSGATITLQQGQLLLSGAGGGKITIDGSALASHITISGNGASRVFQTNSGVQAEFDDLNIVSGVFSGAVTLGGGVFNQGTLTLLGDSLTANHDGAIYNAGTLDVDSSTIQGNFGSSGVGGGGVTNAVGGQVTVIRSTVSGNSASFGAGLFNLGSMTVSDTTVSSNQATSLTAGGGGIFNDGEMTVWRSTISHNVAVLNGGGIDNALHLSVVDSTLNGNTALDGGGIYNLGASLQLTVNSSTISANVATGGSGAGGIFIGVGQFIMFNSIVAGNTPHDLSRNPDLSAANVVAVDAGLAPLANNGGPTQTMALLAGSPAIGIALGATSLTTSVNDSATTLVVGLGSTIARTPGAFSIKIDGEIMTVTAVNGNTLTVLRGQGGTVAASHSAGAVVFLATDQRNLSRAVGGSSDAGAFQTQNNVNQAYVQAAYQSVLGRAADSGGLAYWTNLLAAGTPRSSVASSLVHSDEYYRNIIITPAYVTYLGRQPDPAGLAFWVDQMQNHGLTDAQLEAQLLASTEFFNAQGGGTNSGWIDALYSTFLGRPADAAGKAFWLEKLAEGETRLEIALSFTTSVERQRQVITTDYTHYLGRSPEESAINFWLGQFQLGVTNEDLITALVASDEYAIAHQT